MRKSVLFALAISATILVFDSCESVKTEQKEVEKTEVLAENKESVDMKVEGMVCAMGCAKFIEKEVGSLSGIVASTVDFEEGTAKFEFDKSRMTAKDIEAFINDIHDGQYKASIVSEDRSIESDQVEEVEAESNDTKKKGVASVGSQLQNISLPKLFTYFLKSLR